MTQRRDPSAFIVIGIIAVIVLIAVVDHRRSNARQATEERQRENRQISIRSLGDGSASACLVGYAKESVRMSTDACAQRLTTGTEDSNEWTTLSDTLYGCIEAEYTFAPADSLDEIGALNEGQQGLDDLMSRCQDAILNDQVASNGGY